MNKLKRSLALVLAVCMLMTLVPFSAFAAETGTIGHMASKPADSSTTGEPFPENTGGSYSFRIPAMVTLSDGTIVAAADARWNTTYDGGGLDTIVSRSTNGGTDWNYTFANYLGDNGNQYNGGSTCFIDPSLAVTADDTIYMLVDLYPAGVALNGGKETTPDYTVGFNSSGYLKLTDDGYANDQRKYEHYLKDGKIYAESDPNNPVAGYTVDEHFNIFQNGTYVSNLFFSNSPYSVVRTGYLYLTKSTDGGKNWSAPELLNLKTDDEQVCLVGPGRGLVTSKGVIVFPVYSWKSADGSEYKSTSLIYSADNGKTWQRTNSFSQITSSEAAVVELDNGNIRTFFRNEKGTLCYFDYKLGNNGMSDGWCSTYVDTGIATNSNTQLSAIKYSKTSGGQDVIMVSAPAGPSYQNNKGTTSSDGSYRTNGRIFVGLVNKNNNRTMTWKNSVQLCEKEATGQLSGNSYTAGNGFFAYSCLTEKKDGTVAVLYEDNQFGWGAGNKFGYTLNFKTIPLADLETALGASFDGNNTGSTENSDKLFDETTSVQINLGGQNASGWDFSVTPNQTVAALTGSDYVAYDITIDNGNYTDSAVVTLPLGELAGKSGIYGFVVNADGSIDEVKNVTIENGDITFTAPHFSVVGAAVEQQDDLIDQGNTEYVSMKVGDEHKTYTINGVALNGSHEDSVAKVTWRNGITEITTTEQMVLSTLPTSGSVQRYIGDGNGNFLTLSNGQLDNTTDIAKATLWTITFEDIPSWGNGAARYTIQSGNSYVDMTNGILSMAGSNGNVKHYYKAETGFYGSSDGSNAWKCEAGNWTVGGAGTGNAKVYTKETVTTEGASYTTVTIVAKASGKTSVEIGNVTYNISVMGSSAIEPDDPTTGEPEIIEENIYLTVGETVKIPFTAGAALTKAPLRSVASVTVAPGVEKVILESNILKAVNGIESGKQYIIANAKTGDVLTNTEVELAGDWGTKYGLVTYGKPENTMDELWTITASGDGYTITQNGEYLRAGGYYADVDAAETVLELTYTDDGWVIADPKTGASLGHGDDTNYLSDYVGDNYNGGALGTSAANNEYRFWNIYEVITEITVTGNGVGKTTAVVGNLQLNIDVSAAVEREDTITSNGAGGGTAWKLDTDGINTDKPYLIVSTNNGTGYAVSNVGGGVPDYTQVTVENGVVTDIVAADDSKITWNFSGAAQGNIGNNGNFLLPWSNSTVYTGNYGGYTLYFEHVGNGAYTIRYNSYYLNYSANQGWVATNATSNPPVVYLYTQQNSEAWTVDAALQLSRYQDMTGLIKDEYTDETWEAYEEARKAARNKLNEVTSATYPTETAAQTALNELIAAMDALEAAYNALVDSRTINIFYKFNGSTIETANFKVAANATTLTLPATIVVNNVAYSIDNTTIDLGVDSSVDVPLTKIGTLGKGFVGTQDLGSTTDSQGKVQGANVTGRPVTEMTMTTGVSYTLALAESLTTGQTVVWSTGDPSVATVENGTVTTTGVGSTTVVAEVYDNNGNLVTVNSIPVNVLENNYKEGDPTRMVALYNEVVDNTTVWCVINGSVNTAFEVIEGELIYGYFKKSTDDTTDPTTTTAFTFFGDPDEAHALVYMAASSSLGNYYLLHDDNGDMGIGSEYYVTHLTSGAGYWQAMGLNSPTANSSPDWSIVEDMVEWAITKGCDGGQGFTRRQAEGELCQNLTFVSDPMPKIFKEVNGVLPTSRKQADFRRYTEGMVAAVHELVYFKITVTLERPTIWETDGTTKEVVTDEKGNPYGAIKYTNAIVSDTVLPDAYLYTKDRDMKDGKWDGEVPPEYQTQDDDITTTLNAAWGADETSRTVELYLVYEIQESDIPKFYIDNIAELNYNYRSHYSTGAQIGAADAEARITVVGTTIDDVVIDYGQSVRYTGLTNEHLKGAYVGNDTKATAKYGTVEVIRTQRGNEVDDKGYPIYDYEVIYTPTTILREVDSVQIYGIGDEGKEKVINGFLVYPATTVYYEEGFMLNGNTGWNAAKAEAATVEQTFELLGKSQFDGNGAFTGKISDKKYNYGFDPIYDGVGSDDPAKSWISSATIGNATSFTFTGAGFDLYADCTEASGTVAVQVNDQAGKTVKLFIVNTVVKEGTGASTDGQTGNMDSLPIVSCELANHGTYTVTLRKFVNAMEVKIDGVRIFGTLDENKYYNENGELNSPYEIDKEDQPELYQLRDYVLRGLDMTDIESYYEKIYVKAMAEQVMAKISEDSEAPTSAILKKGNVDSVNDVQNLLDNGPKNEVYIHNGETLAFNVKTSRLMQIGLKAPHGSANYSMSYTVDGTTTTVADKKALNSTVDLFYELGNENGTEKTYTVTITNHSDKLLSVTDLKICDDPNAAFVALTTEDIESVLYAMGYEDAKKAELPEQTKTVDYKHATAAIVEDLAALMPADAGEMTFRLVDVATAAKRGAPAVNVNSTVIDENGTLTAYIKGAKDGETITFTVEVDSDEYETATIKLVVNLAKKGTEIRREKLAEQKVTVEYKVTDKTVAENVGSLMPADAGNVTYRVEKPLTAAAGKGKAKVKVTGEAIDANGNLTASISGGQQGETITFTVKAESDKYEPATIKVVVKLVK